MWCQLSAVQFRAAQLQLQLQSASSGEAVGRVKWSSVGKVIERVSERVSE